ncbi:MAG: glycosyltransferase family 4 protein [Klebsiella huaxiensis]|uniref:glycosyltransferase family 4 protein n=1 Tax=Klebsiella huaxiensis TaxID=2153354 RepID=UPI0026EE7049|nr:glycosyltransferase family 4 protein [Klebsiella huaxiensis]WEJ92061.1 MAG: glycosyltransferase family 4 protein [Klebsiella huaxiensis]
MNYAQTNYAHKRILHIAETTMGGVGTIINGLTKNKLAFCSVICPEQQSGMIECEKKITFERTGRNVKSFFNLAVTVFKELRRNKYSTIHIHSSFAGVIIRSLFLFKILDRKKYFVVFTPHCFSFIMNVSASKKRIYSFIEKILSYQNDVITTNSVFEYEQAILNGINKDRLKIVYNGVSFNKLAKHDLTSSNSVVNILFVGRFDRQKGYDYLTQIIQRLDKDKFFFNIVGDAVHDNISKLDSKNVLYHGWKKKDELCDFFSSNDFLIMPSRWESFGLVAVEAQMNGLPVLANNTSSLPEVVLDKKTGILIDFNNISTVIDFISAHDSSFWNSMRSECMDFAHEKFHEEKMVNEYLNLYK